MISVVIVWILYLLFSFSVLSAFIVGIGYLFGIGFAMGSDLVCNGGL